VINKKGTSIMPTLMSLAASEKWSDLNPMLKNSELFELMGDIKNER